MNRPALHHALLLATLCAATSPAFAIECFSMFDAKNALVYQSSSTPIDLSHSISEQMTRRFPARHLVISDLGSCPETGVAPAPVTNNAQAANNAGPLSTFRRAPSGRR